MVINMSNIKAGYMVHIHSWETDGRFSTKVLNGLSKETVIMLGMIMPHFKNKFDSKTPLATFGNGGLPETYNIVWDLFVDTIEQYRPKFKSEFDSLFVDLEFDEHFDGITIDDKIDMYHTSICNLLGFSDKSDKPYFFRTFNYMEVYYVQHELVEIFGVMADNLIEKYLD